MLHRQGSVMHPTDLTMVLDPKSGTWLVDDGADTDRGDPLAELCVNRQQGHQVESKQRYQLGAQYEVAVSFVSWFRKRNAQVDDFNYEVAELFDMRPKCAKEHEHSKACFETLHMRFLQSKRELWVNPGERRCILVT
jgi:hypothetical protein